MWLHKIAFSYQFLLFMICIFLVIMTNNFYSCDSLFVECII